MTDTDTSHYYPSPNELIWRSTAQHQYSTDVRIQVLREQNWTGSYLDLDAADAYRWSWLITTTADAMYALTATSNTAVPNGYDTPYEAMRGATDYLYNLIGITSSGEAPQ